MEIRDYVRILRRRWVLILGAVGVSLLLAGLVTARTTPQYTSNARIFISTSSGSSTSGSGDTYTNGLAAKDNVASYASLVTDGELTRRVIDDLDLALTPAQLATKLKAQVVPETVLLRLQVTDPDPKQAQRIGRAVVTQLTDMIAELATPPGKTTPQLKGTVVGPPTLPTSPVSPSWPRNLLLGLVLGLLMGLGIAVLRELLDSSVKSAREVEQLVDAPVLGGIAFDAGTAKSPLVTSLSSHAPRAEAFRVLRTNLQFVDIDAGSKVFVVTSSVPGEGKSTTATNVAIAMAEAGQRVLLVDGDLRRPQVARMLGLEGAVGVTTVLLGRIDLDDALQDHHASGLKVLTSGAVPPNPAELLQSQAMSTLLERVRRDFDAIIIDSPPLLPVTDAALLARHTDGAVLVVRHGKTTKEQLSGAAQRLAAVDGRLLGVVFNRVPAKGGEYGYGYGYGYGYAPDARSVDPTAVATPEPAPEPEPEPAPEPLEPEPAPEQEPEPLAPAPEPEPEVVSPVETPEFEPHVVTTRPVAAEPEPEPEPEPVVVLDPEPEPQPRPRRARRVAEVTTEEDPDAPVVPGRRVAVAGRRRAVREEPVRHLSAVADLPRRRRLAEFLLDDEPAPTTATGEAEHEDPLDQWTPGRWIGN